MWNSRLEGRTDEGLKSERFTFFIAISLLLLLPVVALFYAIPFCNRCELILFLFFFFFSGFTTWSARGWEAMLIL